MEDRAGECAVECLKLGTGVGGDRDGSAGESRVLCRVKVHVVEALGRRRQGGGERDCSRHGGFPGFGQIGSHRTEQLYSI